MSAIFAPTQSTSKMGIMNKKFIPESKIDLV